MSHDIRIVLVDTSHPGNIGAVARAMKNMGLGQLVLVRPKLFPHGEATARASGADDVLARARVVGSLAEALEGCGFVAATTSRDRDRNFRCVDVRDAAARLVAEARASPAAVLFGSERSGLTNEDLEPAHVLLRIPASPEYPSLNLAMAVQLVAYELFRARGALPRLPEPATPLASPEQMQLLYAHLEQVLEEIDFRDRTQSGTHLMGRIRRFLQRAELDRNEVNILRGILTAVQNRRRTAGGGSPPVSAAPAAAALPIYLDYAATTPLDPAVAAAMMRCLSEPALSGNAASPHAYGARAATLVEHARAAAAELIGATTEEIVFTSGATEANNLALLGVARANADRGRHIVTSRIEHKAVLDPCRRLEKEGFAVTYVEPARNGQVEPEAVRAALRSDTLLVSIMHVNNETGVVNDLAAIAACCRERGVLVHTDAAQSAGKLPLDARALGVDLLSFTAHKIYGPKGIGALYVARSARPALRAILFGGGQEGGLRPGTLPTHQIAGLGAACGLARSALAQEPQRLLQLRERLLAGLHDLGGLHVNGADAPRVGGILNVSFEGVEGESLVCGLAELAVSRGSACNSASGEPSYVLRALGRSTALAQSSLRFGIGRPTTQAEIDAAAAAVRREVNRLRAVSPDPQAREWARSCSAREESGPRAERAVAAPSAAAPAGAAAPAADALGALAARYFRELPGAGELTADEAAAAERRLVGEAVAPEADTHVRFELAVRGGAVTAARFLARGCPHTLAAVAWLTEQLPGRPREALQPGTPAQWAQSLGVPTEKLGRLLVVEDALRACVRHWT